MAEQENRKANVYHQPSPLVMAMSPAVSSAAGGGLENTGPSSMMSPLQNIMQAVKKEASALEAVKAKIREMDGLKDRYTEAKLRLRTSEDANAELKRSLSVQEALAAELRGDMQRLNDIYNAEHAQFLDMQQASLRLDQELKQSKHEAAFFQKESQRIPEMRKKNSALLETISKNQAQFDEERQGLQKAHHGLEKQLEEATKARVEATSHNYFLTEEIKGMKRELERSDEGKASMQQALAASHAKAACANDRASMVAEDFSGSVARQRAEVQRTHAEAAALKAEADSLRSFLVSKDDAHIAISAKLKSIVDARQAEKAEVKGKIAGMTEAIAALKAKNHDLERECSEAHHRLGMMGGDVGRYTMELEHLQGEVTRAEQARLEQAREIKTLALQRDEAQAKLHTTTQQFEAMQAQSREAQSRYWEELQRVKEAEAQLTEEADHLSRELEDKTSRLIAIEAERAKLDEFMRGEVTGASQMTMALRSELERRLEELAATRKERDGLHEEKEALAQSVAELRASSARSEAQFKKTLETDRAKIQQEIKGKLARLRTVEGEKAELLKETGELMQAVSDAQREMSKSRGELEEAKKTVSDLTTSLETLRAQNFEQGKEVKIAAQKEKELREHTARIETQFREDCQRLDSLVKEARKAAAAQVLEVTSRVASAQDEIEMLRAQKADCLVSEKKAVAEADRARAELELQQASLTEMQSRMAGDMTTMRRELQDARNKGKIMAETRTKMEMETMQARVEATKAENECAKMADWVRELEGKMVAAAEATKKLEQEHKEAAKEVKRSKLKIVDLEESVAKKATAIEKLTKDVSRAEREGQVEARRLRVQLSGAEQEIAELKPTVQLLEKELSEGRSSFGKLQGSTNSTVNGLLEELRATEDALSLERRRGSSELELARGRVAELQSALEKAREHIDESNDRSKKERGDKEMRMLQLENEMDRIKAMVAQKEARMGELEKQHQEDRKRLHDLKEALDRSERAVMDGRTNLELEQAQRRRLEGRLRQGMGAGAGAGAGGSGGGGLGGATLGASSTLAGEDGLDYDDYGGEAGGLILSPAGTGAARAQMLYGDDHTDDGSLGYDGSIDDVGAGAQRAALGNRYSADATGAQFPFSSDSPDKEAGGGRVGSYAKLRPQPQDEDILYQQASDPRTAFLDRQQPQQQQDAGGASSGISPAIDRVSAALAARAAAESTKASLKQAQALRREAERGSAQAGPLATGGEREDTSAFKVLVRKSSRGKVTEVRELIENASSVMGSSDDQGAGGGGGGGGGGSGEEDVEDSIARTQLFLRQRLARAAGGGGGSEGSAGQAAAQAQALAQQALERHMQQSDLQQHQQQQEQEQGLAMSLSAPRLSPVEPPALEGGAGMGMRSSGILGVSADSVSLPRIAKRK